MIEAMPNHPNRSRRAPSAASNPLPIEIKTAREAANLTQSDAAALIYSNLRTWQDWEAGIARMHPAFWELWRLKTAHLRREPPSQPDI